MDATAQFKYALFTNQTRAAHAKHVLESSTHDAAEIISSSNGLTNNQLPLRLTRARIGATFGAMIVAASIVVAVTSLVVADAPAIFDPLAPPLFSLGVLAFVSALFGALAGALSLSTESCTGIKDLRETLDRTRSLPTERRPALLLITDSSDDYDVELLLGEHGAVRTGTVA